MIRPLIYTGSWPVTMTGTGLPGSATADWRGMEILYRFINETVLKGREEEKRGALPRPADV